MFYANVERGGTINFQSVAGQGGTLMVGKHADLKALKTAVAGTARLAYDNETWLCPGVPEAENDENALQAVLTYRDRLTLSLQDIT